MHHPCRRRILSFAFAVLLVSGTSVALRSQDAAPANERKTVRLLTVGNSFSRNAVKHLGDLVEASGHTLVLQELTIGGASMEVHWTKWEKALAKPGDPAGQYTMKRNLRQWLEAGPWDVVTIQQASIKSHSIETYRPFAEKLHALIKQHAPGAKVLLHETWPYRRDDPRFAVKEPQPGEPRTQEEMYRGLKGAYETIAAELNAGLLPVGDAFYLADTDPKWGFKPDTTFDPKKAKQPELPDQTHSLHVGWVWRKQKDDSMKLMMDGHHANLAGEYLGACVWLEVLFNQIAVGNTFVPKGLEPEYAKFLQQTAHRAVKESQERRASERGRS